MKNGQLIKSSFNKYYCIFAALLCMAFSNHVLASPFMGAWQLVSGEYVGEDGKLAQYKDMKLKSMKVLTDKHFSFISMKGDEFWASGGGTYIFDKEKYTEIPVHTSYEVELGIRYTFKYRLEGDKWFNSRWEGG